MIIVMEANAVPEQIQQVSSKLEEKGFQVHLSQGVERTIIGAIGQKTTTTMELLNPSRVEK